MHRKSNVLVLMWYVTQKVQQVCVPLQKENGTSSCCKTRKLQCLPKPPRVIHRRGKPSSQEKK